MTTEGTEIGTVVDRKVAWKGPAMRRYCVALVSAAVSLRDRGVVYFNNDDVPECAQPCDKTTVGAGTKLLQNAGIIRRYRESYPELHIWGGYRASTRKTNHGHSNPLYCLTAVPIALEFLKRHEEAVEFLKAREPKKEIAGQLMLVLA